MAPTVEYQQERKGFWREPGGTPTSETQAMEAWARAAHELLAETAESYHAHLDLEEFAERLQLRSSIRTARPPDRWVSKVLAPVAQLCEVTDQPPLASLVVTDPRADSIDVARQRLECYRWAGSAPADGGVPAPLATGRAPRARSTAAAGGSSRTPRAPREPREPRPAPKPRVAASDRPVTVCPSCFMAIPATGVCDTCG